MAVVAVMGAGSWGTAVAKVAADAGNAVTLWARRSELVEEINLAHTNRRYLDGIALPESLQAHADPEVALAQAEYVVLGVPSQTLAQNLRQWRELIPPSATVVSLAKGIEVSTLRRMSVLIAEEGGIERERIAVLSGPNLAREVAEGQPAATVIACADSQRATRLQQVLHAVYFRPYTNDDVIGVELAGTAKNVIALACGIAAGLGLGNNTQVTLITRGLAEITRLGVAAGAKEATFAGLAGVGDLVATCTSTLSRNRRFGVQLAQGHDLEAAQLANHGQVAEGVKASAALTRLAAQYEVDMPLTRAINARCHEGLSTEDAIISLLGRQPKPE